MGVFKPRKLVVSLRLADDEYQRLAELASIEGAHSLSDMARLAVCDFLEHHNNHSGRHRASEADLRAKVAHLEDEVQRLGRLLSSGAAAGR